MEACRVRRDGPETWDRPDGPVWFVGDLDDPWVEAIADALPPAVAERRVSCPGELPDGLFDRAAGPGGGALHRATLSRRDVQRPAPLRGSRGSAPRPGPGVRPT